MYYGMDSIMAWISFGFKKNASGVLCIVMAALQNELLDTDA